jgi:thymidylate synthase
MMAVSDEDGYLSLLRDVLASGDVTTSRSGNVISKFGAMLKFDLNMGFPLLQCRRISSRIAAYELAMFLRGDTNTRDALKSKGIGIWDGNTNRKFLEKSEATKSYADGEMGPMYGYQWRFFGRPYICDTSHVERKREESPGVDQLEFCLNELVENPTSRRILFTSFNPAQVEEGVLWPCHGIAVQLNVRDGNRLDMMMTQRSADLFHGLPYNIASYAMLLHLFCAITKSRGRDLVPGELIISLGNYHIYSNHIDAVREMLEVSERAREDRSGSEKQPAPHLCLGKNVSLTRFEDFEPDEISVQNYTPRGTFSAPFNA